MNGIPPSGVNPATLTIPWSLTMSFNWYRHNSSLVVTTTSCFFPTSSCHLRRAWVRRQRVKIWSKSRTGWTRFAVTPSLSISRNSDMHDRFKAIQISVVGVIRKANEGFSRREHPLKKRTEGSKWSQSLKKKKKKTKKKRSLNSRWKRIIFSMP